MQSLLKKTDDSQWLNLTPMIDVTFLLIIFFILTGVFASTERAALLPPQLADTPSLNDIKQDSRLVINIVPFSNSQIAAEPFLAGQAACWIVGGKRFETAQSEELIRHIKGIVDSSSEINVQFRADKSILFTQIAPVLNNLSTAGINKLSYIAAPSKAVTTGVNND